MKNNNILKAFGIVVLALVLICAFIGLVIATIPEELETPERTTGEASADGTVTKVKPDGLSITLTNGKSLFLRGYSGYSNGQPVLVNVTVHYIRRYKTISPGVEWYVHTVQPQTTN